VQKFVLSEKKNNNSPLFPTADCPSTIILIGFICFCNPILTKDDLELKEFNPDIEEVLFSFAL
jgi:hypothetical protein